MPLADGGAFTRYLNTETEGYVEPTAWQVQQIGYICLNPDDFGAILQVFEDICDRRDDACTQEQEEQIAKIQYYLLNNAL